MLGKVTVKADGKEVFAHTPRVTTHEFSITVFGSPATLRFGAGPVATYATCKIEGDGKVTRLLTPGQSAGTESRTPGGKGAPRRASVLSGTAFVFIGDGAMMMFREPPRGRRGGENRGGGGGPGAGYAASPLSAVRRQQEDLVVKASVFIGTSLDGFIARVNGDLDFLPPGGGEPHGYDEFIATVDALVIGRKTFETVLKFDTWPYGEKPVFVLSTRSLAPAPLGAVVERLSGDPAEIVSQLDARGIRHVYVDGGITIQRFLQAGLIQRLTITRVPVLIGAGIPLFGAIQRDIVLRHVGTRQYASGLVQSEYVVAAS